MFIQLTPSSLAGLLHRIPHLGNDLWLAGSQHADDALWDAATDVTYRVCVWGGGVDECVQRRLSVR